MLDGNEVAKHNNRMSCWVIVEGEAYDVTSYLDKHPGGAQILLQHGGKDATAMYEPIHPKGTIQRFIEKDKHLGPVDPTTFVSTSAPKGPGAEQQDDQPQDLGRLLSLCLNVHDIEAAAKSRLPGAAWAYYHSATDSLGALQNNQDDWRKVMLRPRVMRNVRRIDSTSSLMGRKLKFPFFIAPAARAALAHEDGEKCLARAAAKAGIGYCVSSFASIPHDEIADAYKQASDGSMGGLWFQLYVANDKPTTLERIEKAKRFGYQALVITVDSAVGSKREEDERYLIQMNQESSTTFFIAQAGPGSQTDEIEGPIPLRGVHSSIFNWEDLPWIRQAWGNAGPIALKGIQTAEDAALAVQYGIKSIYLSNHGGRQCDDAPSSLHTLIEIRRFYPRLFEQAEFFLDGSVRRGSDIVKALCLGASAVGMGRPFMYSVSMGDEGVAKVIKSKLRCQNSSSVELTYPVISEELETSMRLIGATSLSRLDTSFVNTKRLQLELVDRLESLDSPSQASTRLSKL